MIDAVAAIAPTMFAHRRVEVAVWASSASRTAEAGSSPVRNARPKVPAMRVIAEVKPKPAQSTNRLDH